MIDQVAQTGSTAMMSPTMNNRMEVKDTTGRTLATVAFGLSAAAFGGIIIASILLPNIMESRAQSAGAAGIVRAQIAEREARVALDTTQQFQVELAKRGIEIKR